MKAVRNLDRGVPEIKDFVILLQDHQGGESITN